MLLSDYKVGEEPIWETGLLRFEPGNRSKCKGSAARLLQVSGALWLLGSLRSLLHHVTSLVLRPIDESFRV